MAELIFSRLQLLRKNFPHAPITMAGSWEATRSALYTLPPPDVVLLDLTLPDSLMPQTIARIAEIEETAPVVVFTGSRADQVRPLLLGRDVEILEKNPRTIRDNGIFAAAFARAIARFRKRFDSSLDPDDRGKRLDGIIQRLMEVSNGPKET